MFDAIGSSLAQIQAGKFRAIAVTTAVRAEIPRWARVVKAAGVTAQ